MLSTRTPAGLAGAKAPAALALFTFVLGLVVSSAAMAGPWTQTRDGYFTTARLSWRSTSKSYDAAGNQVDASALYKYKDRSVQFDSEYGLSNRLTFLLGMPVQFRSANLTSGSPSNFNNNGFGDLLFGFKYGLLDPNGRSAVALEIDGSTPTGYNSRGFGIPPMGRGKFSGYGRLHVGTTLDPAPVYVQAEFSYRRFTDKQVSNALIYGAEAGVFASPRILIVGEFRSEKSRETDKPYFENLTQAGGQVQYRLKPHVDVLAGLRTTLSGKNAVKGTELRLGVSLKGNDLGRYRGQTAAGFSEGAFPGAAAAAPAPVPVPEPATPIAPAPSDSTSAPATPR